MIQAGITDQTRGERTIEGLRSAWFSYGHWLLATLLILLSIYTFVRILFIQRENYLRISLDSQLFVSDEIAGTQFQRHGLLAAGDKVIEVNGQQVATLDQYNTAIRSSTHSWTTLTIQLGGAGNDTKKLIWNASSSRPTFSVNLELEISSSHPPELASLESLRGLSILKVNRIDVTDSSEITAALAAWSGLMTNYTAQRDEDDSSLIELLFLRFDRSVPWVLFVIGLSFGSVGFMVNRLKPHSRSAWGFFIFCTFMAAFYLLRAIPLMLRMPIERHALTFILCFIFVPSLYFLLTFTPLRRLFTRPKKVVWAAVVYGVLLVTLSAQVGIARFYLIWGTSAATVVAISFSVTWLFRFFRVTMSAADRQRTQIIRLAIFLSFTPMVAYLIVRTLTNRGEGVQVWFESSSVLFPLIISYAIIRYNLLQVSELLLEGLTFTLLMLLVGAGFALIVGGAIPMSERIFPGSSPWVTAVVTGCIAWAALPGYSRARRGLENRFNRAQARYDQFISTIEELGNRSQSAVSFCEIIANRLSTIAVVPNVTILLFGRDRVALQLAACTGSAHENGSLRLHGDALRHVMSRHNQGISRDDLIDAVERRKEEERVTEMMDALQAIWLFPLIIENQVAGILAMGGHADLRNYSRAEVVKLRHVVRECALGIYGFTIRQQMIEKKRADEELLKSEERFRLLAENAEDVIYRYRFYPERELEYISPSVTGLIQRTPEELYNDSDLFDQIVHSDDRHMLPWAEGRTENTKQSLIMRWVRKDGTVVWVEHRIVLVRDQHSRIVVAEGIARDITERKRAEELEAQLLHAQKLEAVGTLAGGVAHDFNNLLTAIFTFTNIAKNTLPYDHPSAESLANVEAAAKQASGITNSLLLFTRKIKAAKAPMNFSAVLTSWLQFLRRILPASIEVVSAIADGTEIWIDADETQIQQVVMNLMINSRDAMPDGGTLRISLSREAASSPDGGSRPDLGAVLTVEDTGVGMSAETQARIFEPFFTTKPPESSSGLGLSIVHGIVTDHGGEVAVESKPGRGTCFTVRLPICPRLERREISAIRTNHRAGRGERIILAEDDENVRAALATWLKNVGCDVIQVSDGLDFMDAVQQHGDSISLAIVDIDLPKKTGRDCLEELGRSGLRFPAIAITANSNFDLDHCDCRNIHLLRKPFNMSVFAELVFTLLDHSKSRPHDKGESS